MDFEVELKVPKWESYISVHVDHHGEIHYRSKLKLLGRINELEDIIYLYASETLDENVLYVYNPNVTDNRWQVVSSTALEATLNDLINYYLSRLVDPVLMLTPDQYLVIYQLERKE